MYVRTSRAIQRSKIYILVEERGGGIKVKAIEGLKLEFEFDEFIPDSKALMISLFF